jgi:hypothetical protein
MSFVLLQTRRRIQRHQTARERICHHQPYPATGLAIQHSFWGADVNWLAKGGFLCCDSSTLVKEERRKVLKPESHHTRQMLEGYIQQTQLELHRNIWWVGRRKLKILYGKV